MLSWGRTVTPGASPALTRIMEALWNEVPQLMQMVDIWSMKDTGHAGGREEA